MTKISPHWKSFFVHLCNNCFSKAILLDNDLNANMCLDMYLLCLTTVIPRPWKVAHHSLITVALHWAVKMIWFSFVCPDVQFTNLVIWSDRDHKMKGDTPQSKWQKGKEMCSEMDEVSHTQKPKIKTFAGSEFKMIISLPNNICGTTTKPFLTPLNNSVHTFV